MTPSRSTKATASPRFRLPWRIVPSLGMDVFRGAERSLAGDARAMVARMQPLPRVIGVRNIPVAGPFVLVANHFEGPGVWVGWTAALLTHAVARARAVERGTNPGTPIHWLAEAEMDRARVGGWKRFIPGTGWAFARVARVWGLVALPRPQASMASRASAIRRLIRLASPPPQGKGAPVGLFPEGEGDGFDGLRRVPDAAGGVIATLARRGVPTVPAAVWFEEGRLTARIGEPWRTRLRGEAAATEVMVRIGALLPRSMHGAYADDIAHAQETG